VGNYWSKCKRLLKTCLGYYELKEHKPRLDERRPKLSDQGKQAKLQWSQDPSQINEDNLNNVRREAYRHFKKKRVNVWKKKLMSLQQIVRSRILKIYMEGWPNLKVVNDLQLVSWRMRTEICLQIPTIFWRDGRIAYFIYWMHIGSVMLGWCEYIQLNHKHLSLIFWDWNYYCEVGKV
jgi:hypothetical protein